MLQKLKKTVPYVPIVGGIILSLEFSFMMDSDRELFMDTIENPKLLGFYQGVVTGLLTIVTIINF